MADRTLTINHADGGSETYTLKTEDVLGVREMSRGHIYNKSSVKAKSGDNYSVIPLSSDSFQFISTLALDPSDPAVGVPFFDSTPPLEVGPHQLSFIVVNNSNSPISGLRLSRRWPAINVYLTEGLNTFSFDLENSSTGVTPDLKFAADIGSSFDVTISDIKLVKNPETITVDRTPVAELRSILIDGQTIIINTAREGVRTLLVDGQTIAIDRTEEVLPLNLTEVAYEALNEYADRTYIVEGVGNYQGATPTEKVAWTYEASDIHVTKSGNDSTGDGSFENPYLTISKGYDVALSQNGGTVWVHGGTYAENNGSGYFLKASDNPANRLYIKGRPDQDVIMTNVSGAYVLRFNDASSNITFQGLEFKASSNVTAFFLTTGSSSQVDGFEFIECHFNDDQVTSTSLKIGSTSNLNNNVAVKRCSFTSDGDMSTEFKNCVGLRFIGNTFNIPNSTASFKAARILTGCSGDIFINNNTFTFNSGRAVSGETPFASLSKVYCKYNTVNASSGEGFLFNGGASDGTCELYINNNTIIASSHGIRVNEYVDKGEALNNTITSAGSIPFGFPTDGSHTGIVKDVIISNNSITSTGTLGHALLVGVNSENIIVLKNAADASNGGYYALVLKGNNHNVEFNTLTGGALTALYLKGASNSNVSSNTIIQDVPSSEGALNFAVDGTGAVSTNNTITKNVFNVSNGGKLHTWGSADLSTGNVVDFNTYNVADTATWGTMFGSTLNSLADVRASWASNYDVTTNDSNSV
jgi:hypothetical protein